MQRDPIQPLPPEVIEPGKAVTAALPDEVLPAEPAKPAESAESAESDTPPADAPAKRKPLLDRVKTFLTNGKVGAWIAAADAWIYSFNPYRPETLTSENGLQPIQMEEAGNKGKAGRYFLLFFFLFMGWAAFAPIDAGVTVSGSVVVKGARKQVQHPSGGVVQEILVKEGAVVKQGDVLLRINPLGTQANLSAARLEYITALATESRLLAERAGHRSITWLPDLLAMKDDPEAREAISTQDRLFHSRISDLYGQISILREQIAGSQEQLKSQQEVLEARRQQLGILTTEATANEELATEGHVPRSRANQVVREKVNTAAEISTLIGDMARNRSNIAANLTQIQQAMANHSKEVETELANTQKNRIALKDRVGSLNFDMSLTEIRAPASGIVVGNKVSTTGGVIANGQVLMEILPEHGKLIAEVDIPPQQIDKVHPGLEAYMRFSAFNVNSTPEVPGRVTLVGADKLPPVPPLHPNEYYLAQIEITDEGVKLLDGKNIQPGMPVEVVIKQGERSFLSYLFKPISDRMARSFKEY